VKNKTNINSADVINLLAAKSHDDKGFNDLLLASLLKAKATAELKLNPNIFKALEWPLDLKGYKEYLLKFSKWIPQQSNDDAWKYHDNNWHKEVFDRLNHFYYLVDQKIGPNDSNVVENIPWFGNWLVEYVNCLGSFLNTTDSFNIETLYSFIKFSPQYRVKDSLINGHSNNPSGWLTFNQFFARELNPGLRPIDNPMDNTVVTTPADCTFRAKYHIGPDSTMPEITVKMTHKFAQIENLLEGSKYKGAFANGTFVHYFLAPYSYHRFHTPVAGVIKECYPVHGLVYLDVNIENEQFNAPDNSEGGYQFAQARGIITIDTTDSPYGNIGIVAIIPIGMAHVSSVNMIATVGTNVLKGEEFGYFLFGGSDIIVLFQEGTNPQIDTNSQYRHYGNQMARCTPIT